MKGTTLPACRRRKSRGWGMGYVPQGRQLFAGMTVTENLALGRLARATDGKDSIVSSQDDIFQFFPRLAERAHVAADYLSGGEQQMLAVARALSGNVKLLLLDEPFEGLAPVIVRDLLKTCRELADAGQTIVIVEQNLAATLALANRVYIINNGHIVHEGPSAELKADPSLLQKYLGV